MEALHLIFMFWNQTFLFDLVLLLLTGEEYPSKKDLVLYVNTQVMHFRFLLAPIMQYPVLPGPPTPWRGSSQTATLYCLSSVTHNKPAHNAATPTKRFSCHCTHSSQN